MRTRLAQLASVQTAVTFRNQAPQADPNGNVRALAIKDLVSRQPLRWDDLHRVVVDDKYLSYCLQPGDVVIPSRGDYYRAWLFEGSEEPVFPVGQLNVIRPGKGLDASYLVWYLNQRSTQAKFSLLLTGTSIKAMTKNALLKLELEVPPLSMQQRIAELDHTTQQIVSIRHRLNELDTIEIAYLTKRMLGEGDIHHA
ncbi:restriction endonuclease subunit S [Burkholderia cenocepacia]|nr:restriction endonuclease subunit S [Burkholderia cenocepacia]